MRRDLIAKHSLDDEKYSWSNSINGLMPLLFKNSSPWSNFFKLPINEKLLISKMDFRSSILGRHVFSKN